MDTEQLNDWLVEIVGSENVINEREALWTYGYDATMGYQGNPVAVAFPTNEDQIAQLLRFSVEENLKWVVRGGATSLAASAVRLQV